MSNKKPLSSWGANERRRKQTTIGTIACPDTGISLTQQHYKDACDINNILSRIAKSGEILPDVNITNEVVDLANLPDYQTALNMVIAAENQFMQLDPKIRLRFENNPGKFLKFVSDPNNANEMYSLGLAIKQPEPTPAPPMDNEPKA